MIESNVNFTSAEVSGWPLENLTSWRRWKTYVCASGISHFSARSGARSRCSSRWRRLSKMRKSRCSEKASVPMRGSRFVGMDSRRKFNVLESLVERLDEQPGRNPQTMRTATNIPCLLTRMGIGDFSHDCGMARAGGAGEIVGALMPGFVGEDGEGEGFFGIAGNAEFVGGNNFQRRQQRDEIGDKQGIASTSAGNDEVVYASARKHKIPESARD